MYCSKNIGLNKSNIKRDKLTCFSKESLIKMAEAYNEKHKKKIIRINGKTKDQIWQQLNKALSAKCENEVCWIDQDFIKDMKNKTINHDTFIPKMPKEWKKNMTTWLTTDDIYSVMRLYELKYPDFMFIGPVPYDCQIGGNLKCELQKLDIVKLYKSGINKLGIIYNTDTSNKPGEHWFAVYLDIPEREISYYDSFATKPPKDMLMLMSNIKKDLMDKLGINIKIDYNHKRHQYDEYNCGMYSMNYIINRLKGMKMKDIEKGIFTTKNMQDLKKILYR